ncbi:MAG: fatty acid CoA ligase family protein [Candidatus Rifleibacteriota bacterium]
MSESTCVCNMAQYIRENASRTPYKRAVAVPVSRDKSNRVAYAHLTFKQLEEETNRFARGFKEIGIKRGTKTVIMLKPGIDFFITFFALAKIGAVMVMIDPGMGIKNLKKCIDEAEPEAFVGISLAHALRVVLRWAPDTIKTTVTLGHRLFWGGYSYNEVRSDDYSPVEMENMAGDEMGAIMFTSGSTGVSKGVVYTHSILTHQVRFIQQLYNFTAEDVDLATFPLFGLFDVCLGMTAVIPDMDATKPAKANPVKLIEAIEDNGATSMFGSPALLDTLSRYGAEKGIKLPSLKRVISCGAPARNDILQRFHRMLEEDVEIFTPYGATESLPVTSIGSKTILGETAEETDSGGGTCVGYPLKEVSVRIIKITDDPIEEWSDDILAARGEIGEIVVKGPIVTKQYYRRPENTRLAKIKEGADVWHRMGDVGRFDDHGRLWFCGRKSHRVVAPGKTYFTIPCERIFNQHPKVFRTALVGIGKKGQQQPVICVELEKGIKDLNTSELVKELREIGAKYPHTADIEHFLLHPGFPVDIRHNAKIGREILSEWAKETLKSRSQA